MRSGTQKLAAVVMLGAAIGLTGCANPIEHLVADGVERMIEEQTGAQIDRDGGTITVETDTGETLRFGAGDELPASFPSSLPLPSGQLIGSADTGDGWALTYQGVDEASLTATIDALISLGFEEVSRTDMGELQSVVLGSSEYNVMLGWFAEDMNLTYVVTKTG